MKKISILSILTLFVVLSSCLELDIRNPNDPDTEKVLSDEENLTSITASLFYGFLRGYYTDELFYSLNSSLEWHADHTTMTNNVLSWYLIFKQEPRQPLTNELSWPNKAQVREPWSAWNGVVVNANTIIKSLEAKPDLSIQMKGLLACSYFSKAMALGYLGSVFDKAYLVPVDNETYVPTLVPFTQVMEESYTTFEKAIALFEEVPEFELPVEVLNGLGYSADEMIRLAKTYYAHFLVSSARNRTQNAQTDWEKVVTLTSEGITSDFTIDADGTNFLHSFQYNSGLFWYFRVDHRILRHFNPNLPKRFPNMQQAPTSPFDENFLKGAGYTGDKRLDAYFTYEADLSFYNASRNNGTLRSNYRIGRYDELYATQGIGPSVLMYAYANQLYKAEAHARINEIDEAIAILNDPGNPRKAVGQMADLPATLDQDEVLEIIFAERDIELGRTEFGLPWFDMRRKDALQTGSLLHIPVPADELSTLGLPLYTFGGTANADGQNTADGSNSWRND